MATATDRKKYLHEVEVKLLDAIQVYACARNVSAKVYDEKIYNALCAVKTKIYKQREKIK
jgi:hypothetical protein